MKSKNIIACVVAFLSALSTGCESADGKTGSAYPTDQQVIQDVSAGKRRGLIDVQVVQGKHGEAYLHPRDLVHYWDRGVVIKREAKLPGVEDAVLIVGGLARYRKVGDQYEYMKFFTTYNSYEGIPEPDRDQLVAFVKANLQEVFVSRDDSITEISKITLQEGQPWKWHTPNSFSVPFTFRYKQIANNTQVDEREDRIAVRFYRNAPDAPIHALMATEEARQILGSEHYSEAQVHAMKTLRTAFK